MKSPSRRHAISANIGKLVAMAEYETLLDHPGGENRIFAQLDLRRLPGRRCELTKPRVCTARWRRLANRVTFAERAVTARLRRYQTFLYRKARRQVNGSHY
jgi:hypothetical protein